MTWEPSRPGRKVSARVRAFVFKRDGGECQLKLDKICLGTASECDHIVPIVHGGSDQPDNLRAVCRPCHARITGQLGRATQLQRGKRPKPPNPGLAR
jgi:5-methylcytosine-specific restriction protein A